MALEAPLSKYRKNTLKIWMAVCIGFAVYCTYDGFFSENFKAKHTDSEGRPDHTLIFNQKSPPYLIGAAVLLGACMFAVRNKKLIAGENELVINEKKRIPYDAIQQIDRTHFNSKGFFVITYEDQSDRRLKQKLSDRTYDNLAAILELLVAKIS